MKLIKLTLLSAALVFTGSTLAAELQCQSKDYTLQLLGSGGPISDDKRASSGEVIWYKGKSRILIDAGGGTFLRFGQSGARLEELKLIGISHLHTDHVADLAAILKGGFFLRNKEQVLLSGPEGGAGFPKMTDYFADQFSKDKGAYAYLSGLYNATDGINLKVNLEDIDNKSTTPQPVYDADGLKVTALGIPHGDVPTLAYRIESPEGVIVVSADQNGSNKAFIDFAKGADILVMPAAIDENADAESKFMHAPPSVVGKIAAQVQPKILVLNHFMGKSLVLKKDTLDIVKKYYHGKVYASRDLSCFPISLAR
ncbi:MULTISPECIES: MBL fold metallo-hydrolase [unclassified Erwinia]|uniref:MBL fold metallo-hydrolase n=1 Tax=unclassified Erwinia TaxID=2622719 RepID=UPI0006FE4388|nr:MULTISPECIES: MBL fold metallo-hydrolase [unclassified Erwinia]KQN60330.1 arylsulfatase [Erwinia sp. Leaf53]PLV60590.1 arylsulfatase [Erwinia sp. B116]